MNCVRFPANRRFGPSHCVRKQQMLLLLALGHMWCSTIKMSLVPNGGGHLCVRYISVRPSNAFSSVTPSAYSNVAPTGSP